MNKMINFFLILCLITLNNNANAQSNAEKIRVEHQHIKIALKDIIGDWNDSSSLNSKISFKSIANYEVQIIGIKHGVDNYSFKIENDSIRVNGFAANWPPYYCTLKLINKNTLEIIFYSFTSSDTATIIYVKK